MNCPRCGRELQMDSEGGYCDPCHAYWDIYDLEHLEAELVA